MGGWRLSRKGSADRARRAVGWSIVGVALSLHAAQARTAGTIMIQTVDRAELLRLAKERLDTDYYIYTKAERLLRQHISKLPNDERLKLVRDSNPQIRTAAIYTLATFFRLHVDDWGSLVKEREGSMDRRALMDAFEPDKLSHSDLASFLNICYAFRRSDDRVLRLSVIESMGRAKVKSKEDLCLVQSVLGLFATDGGHEKDRYRAFQLSHELYKANKF